MLYFLFVKVPFPHFFRLLIAEQVLVDLFSQQLKKKKKEKKKSVKRAPLQTLYAAAWTGSTGRSTAHLHSCSFTLQTEKE